MIWHTQFMYEPAVAPGSIKKDQRRTLRLGLRGNITGYLLRFLSACENIPSFLACSETHSAYEDLRKALGVFLGQAYLRTKTCPGGNSCTYGHVCYWKHQILPPRLQYLLSAMKDTLNRIKKNGDTVINLLAPLARLITTLEDFIDRLPSDTRRDEIESFVDKHSDLGTRKPTNGDAIVAQVLRANPDVERSVHPE